MSKDPGRGLGLLGTIITRGFWWPEGAVTPTPPTPEPNANFRRRPRSRIERLDMIAIEDEEILVII